MESQKQETSDEPVAGTQSVHQTIDSKNISAESAAKPTEVECETETPDTSAKSVADSISRQQMFIGLMFSAVAAVFLSLIPVPSLYATEGTAGLKFFFSFGIGCLMVAPLSAVMVVITAREQVGEHSLFYHVVRFRNEGWHFTEVALPAMSGGVVWSIGNICGFMAFLYLSFAIVNSFVQCQVIASMLLSIVLWREFNTAIEIGIILSLALLMVGGCVGVVYGVFGSFG